jgi:hypothetical protein
MRRDAKEANSIYCMNKHKARKNGMALLLDFERAYDR